MVYGGMEQTLRGSWCFWGEVSAAYCDLAPIPAASFLARMPSEGIRAQAGPLHPVATWVGLTPSEATRGFRESTRVLDLTFAQS